MRKKQNEKYNLSIVVMLGGVFFITFYLSHFSQALEPIDIEMMAVNSAKTYPERWFYTLGEIDDIYLEDYYQDGRLANFIRQKEGAYIAPCTGHYVEVPRKFISMTIGNIKKMLESGLVRYIFRLDSFHGHPFVADERFEARYKGLTTIEMIEEYVQDDSLGVLFHNAEHLALRNPPTTGPVDLEAWDFIKKRNVVGWYDGRDLEVIDLGDVTVSDSRRSFTASIPDRHRNVGSITFKASNQGEFQVMVGELIIYLDISLYECFYH